ncbi:NAD(P)H-dependent flavin oxidoreductase [Colwellia hornerae]|uniref:Nitronate monooxygenase n=1 Tax=Colwellia hornerae TaxID=89402 RepID=A0A5C6QMS1_9GAMM|nr:nitronate monooxygenase family protein [Colwellia hornerae]TWX53723.1 nitronate monooxygenase [Colwellia hornerae]TWX60373.1 nitronate monooxygenase [Colwellia hornerae]TWX70129.1 nitronate monooxygenase [Colwellia hornerae]
MSIPKTLENKLSLPVISAPMFIISGPELVIAECKAGIVGSFPALNARPQPLLAEWLTTINNELAAYQLANPNAIVAPYAVNLIVHKSNDRLEADVNTCIEYKVPVIITSLRALDPSLVQRIQAYGGIIFHDIINIRHAEKAIEAGVDGLVLVCAGAGGHAGTLSPFALVSEIKQFFDGPIALSGAIANGAAILSAQALGADFAYIGTAFIATKEANAEQEYKQMLVEHSAKDIIYSSLFTGVHGNYLKPSIINAGLNPDELEEGDKNKMKFGSSGGSKTKAWKDIWGAGQGLGSITEITTVETIVARFKTEYDLALSRLNSLNHQ